jgi:hypothetical protein
MSPAPLELCEGVLTASGSGKILLRKKGFRP